MVSESSSKTARSICIKIWVAALILAATHILCPAADAYSVSALGLASWQASIAERSISAVAAKLPENRTDASVQRIIKVVADKLFAGYVVKNVTAASDNISLELEPSETPPQWNLEFKYPNLEAPVAGWFAADAEKLRAPVSALIKNIPVSALSWCDSGLRDEIVSVMKPLLPGWSPSMMVRAEGDKYVLQISFAPEMPLVIAVTPHFSSNTLPGVLHSQLQDDMILHTAPFVGLPVAWASRHAPDVNAWTQNYLADRTLVERVSAMPKAVFSAGQVSQLNVKVESSRYYVSAWAAVYAGTSERSAEVGLHLGRIVQLMPHWDMEAYGEGIMELRDWNTEGRLGLRWSPWGDVWLGGEWSSRDNLWWGRLNIEPRLHKPYAWLRISEYGDVNAAIGWKVTNYISLELHYDDRDEDNWSLRMLGNL